MAITFGPVELFPRPTSKSLQDGITGTRKFKMESDSRNELESVIYSACPVGLGDLFPGSMTAQCVSQEATQDENSQKDWTVTCQYKSILNQIEQSRIDYPNPLDRIPRITWAHRTIMRAPSGMDCATSFAGFNAYKLFDPATYIFDGKPNLVANAARDPFDPPLEEPMTEWIATVTKNVTEPPAWVMGYENAVNDSDVYVDGLLLLKGCGKLEGLKIGERMKENGTVYRQLSYSIICRPKREKRAGETDVPEPWDIEVLNEGMRTFNASSKWENIKDSAGQSVAKPVPLDVNGKPIDPSGAPIAFADLTWMLFRNAPRKDFKILPGISGVI